MSEVVNISDEIYSLSQLLADLHHASVNIREVVCFVELKDGTSYISHTGVPLNCMALACKSMDNHFHEMMNQYKGG